MTKQVKIVEFQPQHLWLLDLQEEQKYLLDDLKTAHELYQYGLQLQHTAVVATDGTICAWTAMKGDKVVGCGGIVYFNKSCGEAWLLLSEEFMGCARHIIPEIKRQAHLTPLNRVHAYVDMGFKRAEKFLEWVGFNYETTLEKIGIDNRDQKIYKIVKE